MYNRLENDRALEERTHQRPGRGQTRAGEVNHLEAYLRTMHQAPTNPENRETYIGKLRQKKAWTRSREQQATW